MPRQRRGRPHRSFLHGGRPKQDAPLEDLPKRARNRSWHPEYKGQGGEGLSEGYGGSGGSGTGPSGPDNDRDDEER